MDILKRERAPILAEAWTMIDDEARRVLKLNLAGRKLVDFDGPYGWGYASVNLGRLQMRRDQPVDGVHTGLRVTQPLVEIRVPVFLDIMELDYVGRGAADPDLGAVVEAAERIARAEDNAIFNGYPEAGIKGICQSSPHETLSLPQHGADYPHQIVMAKEILREAGIGGPHALAMGPDAYNELAQAADDGYPIRKHIQQIVDGPIVRAPSLDGAVLLSIRGGDFQLTVGQDFSVGYANREKNQVELFITESFTFRVLEPAAAVYLRHAVGASN